MSAGLWNTTLEAGAFWTRTLTVTDAQGAPVVLTSPAYMELRATRLIARLDDSGATGGVIPHGSVLVDSTAGKLTLEMDETETAKLPAGRYAYDLWVTVAGKPVRLLAGSVTVIARVSKP